MVSRARLTRVFFALISNPLRGDNDEPCIDPSMNPWL
jgi:hypothetical protein